MPSTAPSTRAVTTPTRSPVYGPGPTPTATAVRSARDAPASAMTFAIMGASSSPWRRPSEANASETTRSPSCKATLTAGVAVSKPTTSTPPSLAGARGCPELAERGLGRLRERHGGGGQAGLRHRPVRPVVGVLEPVQRHRHDHVVIAHHDGGDVGHRATDPVHLQGAERLVPEPGQDPHRGPRGRGALRRGLHV